MACSFPTNQAIVVGGGLGGPKGVIRRALRWILDVGFRQGSVSCCQTPHEVLGIDSFRDWSGFGEAVCEKDHGNSRLIRG